LFRRFLTTLLVAGFLTPVTSSFALVGRRAWVFEQMATPAMATAANSARYQISLSQTHYQDMTSVLGSVLLDLRVFEIGLKGSRRVSLGIGPDSDPLNALHTEDRTMLGLEIARYFQSASGHFGRLGLEFVEGLPQGLHWLRLNLQTGVLSSPASPWGLRLNTNFFWSLSGRTSTLLIGGQIDREISRSAKSKLSAGGLLRWSLRPGGDPLVQAQWEYISFTFGPFVKWEIPVATFQLETSARWWIDRQRVPIPGGEAIHYPSDIRPALTLNAWVPL